MSKKQDVDNKDTSWFRNEFSDIRPLRQDKITPKRVEAKQNNGVRQKNDKEFKQRKQAAADFQFSDGFEAHFSGSGPLKYTKPGADSFEIKRLRRGEYPPELVLDLHGLNRQEAKLEISALIHAAKKQHVYCVCIVHGVGGNVLKKAVPNWLVQHPSILGFHQAPLEWGGKGALLVLIEQR